MLLRLYWWEKLLFFTFTLLQVVDEENADDEYDDDDEDEGEDDGSDEDTQSFLGSEFSDGDNEDLKSDGTVYYLLI